MRPLRPLTRLGLYAGLLLTLFGVIAVSVGTLMTTFESIAGRSTPTVEVSVKRPNVPLPPVIEPQQPKVERVLTAAPKIESSFTTIGPPSGQASGDTLGMPGQSSSFVTLPAATTSAP